MAQAARRVFPIPSGQPFETWQVAAAPMPVWLPYPGGPGFYRVWVVACVSLDSENDQFSELGPREDLGELAEEVISRAGWRWRTRPARIQVSDVALAGVVERLAASEGVAVEVKEELRAARVALERMVVRMTPADLRPSPLTGDGVTLERLAAFARAAGTFHGSSCWSLLDPARLIEVEAPEREGFRFFLLTRRLGDPNREFVFFSTTGDPEELLQEDLLEAGFWSVSFERHLGIPPEDLDLWDRLGLPWIEENILPVACFLGAGPAKRPNARQLAFLEGLLRALAFTSEAEVGSGRWGKWVETADGPVLYRLSLTPPAG